MSLPRIIVSATSYPARLSAAARGLRPFFRQTVPIDGVELWLARDEFDEDPLEVAPDLRDLVEAGLSLRWCEHSLRPHNKYFWAMQEHPNDIVVTVDDDILYPPSLVQGLLELHYRHPEAVVANRTHFVTGAGAGCLAPYDSWVFAQAENFDEPRFDLLATGVGGVLYPPHIFDAEVFDEDAVRATCLPADDLWLFVHELRLGIPVVNTWAPSGLAYIPDSQDIGLYHENLENGRNDRILAGLFERYPAAREALVAAVERREGASAPADAQADGSAAATPGGMRHALGRLFGQKGR